MMVAQEQPEFSPSSSDTLARFTLEQLKNIESLLP
jgi:hypothetical protein